MARKEKQIHPEPLFDFFLKRYNFPQFQVYPADKLHNCSTGYTRCGFDEKDL
ncbi:MAG: hypothetical protein UT61_C0045G0018 [Candidatus Woesebacteria bacterium GW2011_GWA1_39_8]|uniref:Uncharacterized protein n=1 Tax=Candidatus Woesebacteria bacterium GW2011_GWA1_39_8 TaxID=1618552 RepID=A0A0G0SSW1_9BACT|nr:MAG: hypothetical protein UT61_C0045G0018 [Candidatus Woesebacteria bacterium GW2011_GWA1_39_8]